jgi:hypothetical protein
MNLFKLITLDGREENLPKESGIYDCKMINGFTEERHWEPGLSHKINFWMASVHSYYAPVDIECYKTGKPCKFNCSGLCKESV